MRGKAEIESYADECDRITPAHAGKSDLRDEDSECFRDHPRACGEKEKWYLSKVYRLGSPPRMRGKETLCVYES